MLPCRAMTAKPSGVGDLRLKSLASISRERSLDVQAQLAIGFPGQRRFEHGRHASVERQHEEHRGRHLAHAHVRIVFETLDAAAAPHQAGNRRLCSVRTRGNESPTAAPAVPDRAPTGSNLAALRRCPRDRDRSRTSAGRASPDPSTLHGPRARRPRREPAAETGCRRASPHRRTTTPARSARSSSRLRRDANRFGPGDRVGQPVRRR